MALETSQGKNLMVLKGGLLKASRITYGEVKMLEAEEEGEIFSKH